MTPYGALLAHCGLSLREAAEFHGIRPDTVRSWSSGRNRTPPGVLAQLRDLAGIISAKATRLIEMLEAVASGGEIAIGYPVNDHEARALGLPCVGAWRAMIGQVLAVVDRPIKMVPRG